MLRLLIVTLSLQAVISQGKNYSLIGKLISDFVQQQNILSNVLPHLCWNKEGTTELSKLLHTTSHNVAIQTKNNSIIRPIREEHSVILLDLNCNISCSLLKQVFHTFKGQESGLLKYNSRWILLGDPDTFSKCNIDLRVDSRIYLLQRKSSENFKVLAVYSKREDTRNYIYQNLGFWNKANGFENFEDIHLFRDRKNLNGTEINISYIFLNPHAEEHIWDYRNRHSDGIITFVHIMMHYTMDLLNAKRNLLKQSSWGTFSSQHNASGFLGSLMTGEADLGGSPLFMLEARVSSIDYIASSMPTYMKFILKAPPLSYVSNIFIQPFDRRVWCSILLLIILVILGAYVVAKWEWAAFEENEANTNDQLKPTLTEAIMLQLSSVAQQGSAMQMKSAAGRIVIIFTLVAFMFLYNSYSANIVALLQSTSSNIHSLEDLLYSRIEIGVENSTYAMPYFLNAKEPLKKALYSQKVAPPGKTPNIMSMKEGISKMRNEFFAFHAESQSIYEEVARVFEENEKCNLIEITFENLREPFFATKKNSSYKELVNIGLNRMLEVGVHRREQQLFQKKKPQCSFRRSTFVSAGLLDTYFPFSLFLSLLLISGIIFIIEVIHHKLLERKEAKADTVKVVTVKI